MSIAPADLVAPAVSGRRETSHFAAGGAPPGARPDRAAASARRNRRRFAAAFTLGLALVVVGVALLPSARDGRYAALTGDARQLADTYRRINHDPKPIDIAFIGSSHTLNGIDDRSIEAGLAKAGRKLDVANLAVRWPGRDLELLMVKQLFAAKTPKLLVIELDQHEEPAGHRLLPYVADLRDLFCCKWYLDYDFPNAMLTFLRRQVRDAARAVWSGPAPASPAGQDFGWVPLHEEWTPEQAALSRRKARSDGVPGSLKMRFMNAVAPFGLDAVGRMAELARAHGAQVAFLYLPARHYLTDGPELSQAAFYRALGPVLPVPRAVAADDGAWANWSHLNATGAARLVPCMVDALSRLTGGGAGPAAAGCEPVGSGV